MFYQRDSNSQSTYRIVSSIIRSTNKDKCHFDYQAKIPSHITFSDSSSHAALRRHQSMKAMKIFRRVHDPFEVKLFCPLSY